MTSMAHKSLTIEYQEFASMEDMMPEDRSLLESAIGATKGSYAPFSHYNVGAAVLLSDGTVVQGANQENAAFPSGLCAESACPASGACCPCPGGDCLP